MIKRRKKNTKQRGSKSHGWGSKKKHRGAGSRGGRGAAGMMKHKKQTMLKECPDRFGRRGFKVPNSKKIRAITLREIDLLSKSIGLKEIDVSKFGYIKVLSSGKLSKGISVKAKEFSKKAKEKIAKLGGSVIEG